MSKPEKTLLVDRIGVIIFAIRWGLVPMYVGLWVAVIAYNIQFFREIFDFTFTVSSTGVHLRPVDSEMFLMWVLGLIDITMIANLVVMIVIGGYSTFVKEFDLKRLEGKPRWMNGLDSNTLKIKMAVSLVGVSAIQLLQTFMIVSNHLKDMLQNNTYNLNAALVICIMVGMQIAVHITFIVTTLGFTINAKLLHGHTPKPSEINEH